MWMIKDPTLKEKINHLLSDEIVAQGCNRQMDDNSDYILLSCGEVDIKLKKESFENVPEYDPEGWNPFPDVKPPANGRYLVTRQMKIDNGDTAIFIQLAGFENGQWFMKNDVIAFRELPKPYNPKYERKPWDDDDSESEEGD